MINEDNITDLVIDLHTMDANQFLEKHDPPVDLEGKRYAFTIVVEETDKRGNYVPCIAIENERGYYPLSGRGVGSSPWTWGSDYNKACEMADHFNEKLGLSKREAFKIVDSSMLGGAI